MANVNESSGRPPEYYGYILIFFILAISGLGTWFAVIVIQYLGLSFETNFLAVMRLVLSLTLLVVVFPVSILIEAMWVRWRKKRFHMAGVFASALLLLESILVVFVTATVFDFLIHGLYFTEEPFIGMTGLVLGLMVALPMIFLVLTIRIPDVHTYLEKAFE